MNQHLTNKTKINKKFYQHIYTLIKKNETATQLTRANNTL